MLADKHIVFVLALDNFAALQNTFAFPMLLAVFELSHVVAASLVEYSSESVQLPVQELAFKDLSVVFTDSMNDSTYSLELLRSTVQTLLDLEKTCFNSIFLNLFSVLTVIIVFFEAELRL